MNARRRSTALVLASAMTVAALLVPGGSAGATTAAKGDQRLAAGNAVLAWNDAATRAAIASGLAPLSNPLQETRMYTMAHLAINDALNAIDRRAESYAAPFRARRGASPRAAVAAAAHDTLVSAIAEIPPPFDGGRPAATQVVEDFYAAELAAIPNGVAERRGVAAGQRAAAAIIADRVDDGSDTPLVVTDFPQGTRPGEWRFTIGTGFAFAPGWGAVKPFALTAVDQFPSAGPLKLSSRLYADNLNEVKRLGGDGVDTPSARTPRQTESAYFWDMSSPLMWNRVGAQLATSHHLDAWDTARMLGQLNVALADGYIASWAKKYDELFWRPETAIREAENDHNRRTSADPQWLPLRPSAPIPDHDSAHAVEGGAAAGALRTFFGTDRLSFTVCSDALPSRACTDDDPVLRTYHSINAAAGENAISRVWIGYHFRWASEVGNRHGKQIGRWAATSILQPVCART